MPKRLERLNAQKAAKAPETGRELDDSVLEDVPEKNVFSFVSSLSENKIVLAGIGIAFAIALIALLFFFLPNAGGFELVVTDSSGNPLEGAIVNYSIGNARAEAVSDSQGKIFFTVEKGSRVLVSIKAQEINGKEFEAYSESFVANGFSKTIVLKSLEEASGEKTIVFQDKSGARITGKEIAVKLSCANGYKQAQETVSDNDKDGEIKIVQEKECNALSGRITGPEELKQTTFSIKENVTFVTLESNASNAPKGKISVRIIGTDGRLITGTSFKALLIDSKKVIEAEKQTGSFGSAVFTGLDLGNYTISVSDSLGEYPITTAKIFLVSSSPEQEKIIEMEKSIKGTIIAKVFDKTTGEKIANATIQLQNEQGEIIAEEITGSYGKPAEFAVREEGKYTLTASQENYLPNSVETEKFGETGIELEPLTEENSGIVEVAVTDEYGEPVENAGVVLQNEAGETMPYGEKTTDSKGTALFKGVKEGLYYALAEKFPSSGYSEIKEVLLREKNFFAVQINIGKTTVEIEAVDEQGALIEETEIEIFSENGTLLEKSLLSEGTGKFEEKAGKKIFVVAKAAGYETTQTISRQLWPNEKTGFKITLALKKIIAEPELEFEGIFENNEKTGLLSAGGNYIAVFSIRIPENSVIAKAGLHFRLGDSANVYEENSAITGIYFGNPENVLKGTSYSPKLGFEKDAASDIGSETKWVNIEFLPSAEEKKYMIGIGFKVKAETMPGALIQMHYGAFFENENSFYSRIPNDEELGNTESTAGKQGLYAETISLEYKEGEDSDCGEMLCYGEEWLFDNSSKKIQREDYEVVLNRDYNLNFKIRNNSSKKISGLKIFVETGSEKQAEFKALSMNAGENSAVQANAEKIESIEVPAIEAQESMDFSILFTPKNRNLAYLEIKLKEGFRDALAETVWLDAQSGKEMLLEILPEKIPALAETELTIKAVSEGTSVSGAKITMTKIAADNSESRQRAVTGQNGEAKITLPSSMPGTRLVFEAEKDGYYSEPVEKIIPLEVFSLTPEKIESKIDTKANTEETKKATIANLSGTEIEISSIKFSINSQGLLDMGEMQSHVSQFLGTKIGLLQESEISFKAKFLETAELEKDASLQGEITISVLEKQSGKKFDKKIPLEIKIRSIEEGAVGCLKISKTEWLGFITNNSAVLEIEIENNCSGETSGAALTKVLGKTVWKENALGIVELMETELETYEAFGENNWHTIKRNFEPGEKITAFLVFTPKQGALGKTAEFSILFDGQVEKENTLKFVGSTEIKAKIDSIDIEQCITTDKDKIEILQGSDTAGFLIDTSKCMGKVKIALCRNDSGCKGGAEEGEIKLNVTNFSLNPGSKAKINVSKQNLAGIYGIEIEAKTENSEWQWIKTVDAFIEPETGANFTLDKYEFSLLGEGTKDSAVVFNPNLAENIEVFAPVNAWNDSVNNTESFFDPELAGTGSTHLELENAKIAADKAKEKMEEMALAAASETGKGTGLTDMAKQALDQGKKQADQADQKAQQLVDSANSLTQAAEAVLSSGEGVYTAANSGCMTLVLFCCEAAAEARRMNTALKAAKIATMGANAGANAAKQATGQGKNNCEQGKQAGDNGLEQAKQAQAGACSTRTTASRSEEGSSQAAQAAQEMAKASMQDNQCGQQMGNAGQQATQAGTQAAGIATQIAIVESALPTIMKCATASGPMSAFNGQFLAFKTAHSALTGASSAAQQQANKAQQAAQNASNASNIANGQDTSASEHLNELSIVELNPQEASKFGNGRTIGILGSYIGLGTLVGGYAGNAYNLNLEGCSEGFNSMLPDFITNLKEDSLEVLVNNPKITGNWNSEEAKIFGEYESQTAGIWLENKGLESEKPVFATATLTAKKHVHEKPTKIEAGAYAGGGTSDASYSSYSTFGPFNVPDKEETIVSEKFHLKFNTSQKKQSPAANYSDICTNGALLGATGEEALPKIRLNWDWHEDYGISENACLDNNKGIFCDASQFSIMASKKLKTLQEFVEKNSSIACPKNPAIEDLNWLVSKWNGYLNQIGSIPMTNNLQQLNPECWMPKSTFLYDGKPALNYYVEEAKQENKIQWTGKIKSTEELKSLVLFDARLIKDGYSKGFEKDFADYYTRLVLLNAPEWFTRGAAGKFSDYFSKEKLLFKQKFLSSTELPNAGTFEAFLNIDFGNKWQFFNETKQPSAEIKIEFSFKKEPEQGSVFYYLPFDASMGSDTIQNRNGYGTGYENEEKDFTITNYNNQRIGTSAFGTGITALETKTIEDPKILNSSFAKRGTLLEITSLESKKQLSYYPSYATPIAMSVEALQSKRDFSAYFRLQNGDEKEALSENLSYWTGFEQCTSFDGTSLNELFGTVPDRYAEELDTDSPASAYALDFENPKKTGTIFFKTIFYSPIGKGYSLNSLPDLPNKKADVLFSNPDSGFGESINLEGISTGLHNNRKALESVTGLQSLFDLVKSKDACITNGSNETAIWWNEEALEQKTGANNSLAGIEAASQCK